jgi:hypothetical protein
MPQPFADCRVYQRHACQVPALCQPAAANEMRWEAIIEDISKGGVRLRLPRRFEPRSGLAIEMPGSDGHDPATVYVKVVHVRRNEDGSHVLGCKFMSELSDEEVERLLSAESPDGAAVPQPAAAEEPARTIVPGVRLWIGVGKGEFIRCRVKRFHAAGSWPPAPGKALNLRGVARNGSRLEHPFEVVDCSPEGEGWLLQVRPVEPSSDDDVRAAFAH